MYIHSDFIGNPTKTNQTIPYYPIRLRRRLEEGEVEPSESTTNNYDYHTLMITKELQTHSRFRSGKECIHLGF